MSRRIRDLYDEHGEYSTVSKSCCYRNLSCRHSVGVVIEQNPRSTQTLDFYVSVFWNLIRGEVTFQVYGEPPQVPVVSQKYGKFKQDSATVVKLTDAATGAVFEKRLIGAYLAEHSIHPVTGTPLSKEDSIEVKSSNVVHPRAPTQTFTSCSTCNLSERVGCHSFTDL